MKLIQELSKPARLALGVTREAGASLLASELYPLAILGNSLPALPVFWTKTQSHKRPILLIHGIFHNKSAFFYLKQKLALRGWHHFREVNLLTSVYGIESLARKVKVEVERLREEYETDQVDMVAHSLGGLIARYYLQKLEGDGRVKNLVTLGTPHLGTKWSKFSFLSHMKDLQPKSPQVEELNRFPPPLHTRVVAVSGKLDFFMSPKETCRWPGVRSIELDQLGHAGLLFSKRVTQIITSHFDH